MISRASMSAKTSHPIPQIQKPRTIFLVNEGCGVDIFIEPYASCGCYSGLKALTMNK
jgi:hypothetical protein